MFGDPCGIELLAADEQRLQAAPDLEAEVAVVERVAVADDGVPDGVWTRNAPRAT